MVLITNSGKSVEKRIERLSAGRAFDNLIYERFARTLLSMSAKSLTASSSRARSAKAEPLRFILDEDGKIVHGPEGFRGRLLADAVGFADPDEILRAQGLFGRRDHAWIDGLREGTHMLLLPEGQGQRKTAFQFDRVGMPDGRAFMLVSEVLKGAAPPDDGAEFVGRFVGAARAAAPLPQKPAIDLSPGLDLSHDVIVTMTREGLIAGINAAFRAALNYDETAVTGRSFIDFVYSGDRVAARNALQALAEEEGEGLPTAPLEIRLVTADGQRRTVEWRMKRVAHVIYAVGRDISAMRAQEAALRQQAQMLSEAQAIGRMGHWRWMIGEDSISWSDEIYRIFGLKAGEFTPSLGTLTDLVHKRDIGRVMQAFQRAIIEQNDYDMEFRIVRPDGETRYIRCEGRCERDHNREVVALFGIMQDMTERYLYERDLRAAKDAAEQAYAAKTQFLANMSHELRTPLNAIIGFSEMMQRQLLGPIGNERYIDYIAGIRESGEHLLDLISDILDMSKIEAGKYELDLQEVNLSKVLRLAAHMMEGRAQEGKLQMDINIEREDLSIVADRRAVMQVALNLLSNAIKFTEPGGKIGVECRVRRDQFVTIRVTDTGIGIPANKIAVVTRPFEQAASHYTREHEGTGLGLAITKDLVEMHGGSLHIESTVGIGTAVTVRLPLEATRPASS